MRSQSISRIVCLTVGTVLLSSCGATTAQKACSSWDKFKDNPRESMPFFAELARQDSGYKYLLDAISTYSKFKEWESEGFIRYSEQIAGEEAFEEVEIFCSKP